MQFTNISLQTTVAISLQITVSRFINITQIQTTGSWDVAWGGGGALFCTAKIFIKLTYKKLN